MYYYGLIGNCQISALVSKNASIDWLCLPRPDSPPVFGKLLDSNGGCFAIEPIGNYTTNQYYIENTNVLVTHFFCEDDSEFTVTDFCPRFELYNRKFRPCSLFRIIEVKKNSPVIRVKIDPVKGWDKKKPQFIRGNSHIKYNIRDESLRITSNMSMTILTEGRPFNLIDTVYFSLTWNHSLEDNLIRVSRDFLERTIFYWRTWVKHCSIPTNFQKEIIRSALILKLHCYEDTGAILAALTTSLPEEFGGERNWDYRHCWLRDAGFVLSAFQKLGHFEEMEGFLHYLLNIANLNKVSNEGLRPVYSLDMTVPFPEVEHSMWEGYAQSKPVRSNNQAASHIQNDVYGEMILSLSPIFFDERFSHLRKAEVENLIVKLVKNCEYNISRSDAGLWEFRDGWQEHSFSNLMCWAGIDRAIHIHNRGFLSELNLKNLQSLLDKCQKAIEAAVVDGSLRNGPQDKSFDASLLFLPLLRYPNAELCKKTVIDIYDNLQVKCEGNDSSGFLYRYLRKDDFGVPKSSFLICSFWLTKALEDIGKHDLALTVIRNAMSSANHLGLFSEHYIPSENKQCGNFPQAYSHVGLINAAFSVSPSWDLFL